MKKRSVSIILAAGLLAAALPAATSAAPAELCPRQWSLVSVANLPGLEPIVNDWSDRNGDGFVCVKGNPNSGKFVVTDNNVPEHD